MGQWSRDELEAAFRQHEQVVVEIGKSGDWSRFADEFTEDATYVDTPMDGFRAGRRSGTGSSRR